MNHFERDQAPFHGKDLDLSKTQATIGFGKK